MDKILDVSDYGICLFSLPVIDEFLKKEKVRSKKLLANFQKNHDRYLRMLESGIWLPFLPIDSIDYLIKMEGQEPIFGDEWKQKMEHGQFNLTVKDSVWITSISYFNIFDRSDYVGDKVSYRTLDGVLCHAGFRYDVPSGKYLVSIKGYARKQKLDYPNPNYGFLFSLVKVNEFNGFNDPREDEIYNFNVSSMDRKSLT
ncbi:hypothetical protein [Anaerocolumna jejuensis]|uniref:hypothetical protein n=1 Tax=Anaerocolumna jejuensis TaxID=259063 RepID=UPI003F7B4E89